MNRELSERERRVIEWVLAGEFDGVDELRAQIPRLRVLGGCTCGCPSVDFVEPGLGLGSPIGREGYVPGLFYSVALFARGDGVLTTLDLLCTGEVTPTEFPDAAELVETVQT